MKQAVDRILQNQSIRSVFQPIISLRDGTPLGYEALSRIDCESEIPNIGYLFQVAEQCEAVWDLEQLCRIKALESAYKNSQNSVCPKLFINVNPYVLQDPNFREGFTKKYLDKYGILPENVIIEITERSTILNMNVYKEVVNHYKKQKYRIAIDDAGAGYSGLLMISNIHPHYIKIDMELVRNIDKDELKYAVVKGLVELSHLSNIQLIGEGIETQEELETLIDLGVQYGQGYFLKRPCASFELADKKALDIIAQENHKKNSVIGTNVANTYIRSICKKGMTVSPHIKSVELLETFQNDESLLCVTVVGNNQILGLITRSYFLSQMGGLYGFSLYQNKYVSALMEKGFTFVDYRTPINMVSKIAMQRNEQNVYDPIVITDNQRYFGIVTIKELLLKTTEIELTNAKHQNPLTGLPGNNIIQETLAASIQNKAPFSALYIDIDNFKAYNDTYGFEKGDMIIRKLAEILCCSVNKCDFVGHIGGDDFLIVLKQYDFLDTAEEILKTFREATRTFYTKTDFENGFITAENRKGTKENFPLVSLSIACLTNRQNEYTDAIQVSEKLSALKHLCKKQTGNCYLY